MRSNDLALEKLPRAQDTFSLDMYQKAGGRVVEGKRDLFSGLDQTVKSINFNNISSDSLAEVTIHKRNRPIDDSLSQASGDSQSTTMSADCDAPKKKKYKMVPNSFVSPPLKREPAATASQSPENSPNAVNVERKALPKDRKELLMFVRILLHFSILRRRGLFWRLLSPRAFLIIRRPFLSIFLLFFFTLFDAQVKDILSGDKYRAFLKVFLEYNNNTCYESFKTGLFGIFEQPQWFYILEGMVRFTRSAHRDTFEKDVAKFIAARSK